MGESPLHARHLGLAPPAHLEPKQVRRRYVLAALAVFVGCLGLFTLGNDAQFWDRDEPRYAETTRAMLKGGDFVVPTHNGEWRLSKPVGIYWLQAASISLLGDNEFAARFPSALLLAFAALLLFHTAWRFTRRLRAAVLTVFAFAGCLMTQYQAHAATIDASLLLVIALTMLIWFEALQRANRAGSAAERRRNAWRWVAFYVLGALGVLLKMPVIVAVWFVVALAYVVWNFAEVRDHVRLRPVGAWMPHLVGISLGLAVSLPWLIAVNAHTDGAFLARFIGHDVLTRAAEPLEGHSGPLVYYLPVLLIFFFPWSLLLLVHLRNLPETLSRPTLRFLVCWAVAPVVLFSFMATKLPHYVFPSFPAFALLTGLALDAAIRSERTRGLPAAPAENRAWRYTRFAVVGVFALVGLGAFGIPVGMLVMGITAPLVPATVAALALGLGAWLLAYNVGKRRTYATAVVACVSMLVLCVGLRFALPAFDEYKRGPEVAAVLHAEITPPDDPLSPERPVLHGFSYAESSLVYYTGFIVKLERGRDRAHLATLAQEYAERGEPMWFLMAFPASPDELSQEAHAAQLAEWAPEARAVYERSRLLGRVGPVFHYNTGRDHWRLLELRTLAPPQGE